MRASFAAGVLVGASLMGLMGSSRAEAAGQLSFRQCLADNERQIIGGDVCRRQVPGVDRANDLVFSHDRRSLYLPLGGENGIARFQLKGPEGVLRYRGCIQEAEHTDCERKGRGLTTTHSVALTPDDRLAFAAGFTTPWGFDSSLTSLSVDRRGSLRALRCISLLAEACSRRSELVRGASALALSGDGSSLYLVSRLAKALVHYRVGPSGRLRLAQCFQVGSSGSPCKPARGLSNFAHLELAKGGRSLYAASPNDDFATFSRNTRTGKLRWRSCIGYPCGPDVSGLTDIRSLALSPDDRSLYVGTGGGTVVHFASRANGMLRNRGCVDAAWSPRGCNRTAQWLGVTDDLDVSGDGASLYMVAGDLVGIFERSPGTGAIRPRGCLQDPNPDQVLCKRNAQGIDGASSVAVSPNGRSVYVFGSYDNAIVRFHRRR
jgi:hypothetical protein